MAKIVLFDRKRRNTFNEINNMKKVAPSKSQGMLVVVSPTAIEAFAKSKKFIRFDIKKYPYLMRLTKIKLQQNTQFESKVDNF